MLFLHLTLRQKIIECFANLDLELLEVEKLVLYFSKVIGVLEFEFESEALLVLHQVKLELEELAKLDQLLTQEYSKVVKSLVSTDLFLYHFSNHWEGWTLPNDFELLSMLSPLFLYYLLLKSGLRVPAKPYSMSTLLSLASQNSVIFPLTRAFPKSFYLFSLIFLIYHLFSFN